MSGTGILTTVLCTLLMIILFQVVRIGAEIRRGQLQLREDIARLQDAIVGSESRPDAGGAAVADSCGPPHHR